MRTLIRILILLGAAGLIIGGAFLASLTYTADIPAQGTAREGAPMPPGSGNETGPSSVEGGTPPAGGEGIGRQREESGFSSSGLVQVGQNLLYILIVSGLVITIQKFDFWISHKKKRKAITQS